MSFQPKMTLAKVTRARLLATAATSAALMFGAGAPAFAQDEAAAAEDVEVITVTGYRKSIQDSIAAKREAQAIVEAISAEDIGKLPDVSIAESLGRLPGIAAQRVDGRAQVISVRGLAPDFTTALLNGREIVSAGDNRGVEFDQFPSEILNQVLVYKTPEASLVGQGLAGTADLRTVRPLSYDERVIQFGARYEFNELEALNPDADDDGYRFSATYIDQTDDGRWGIALGGALSSTPTQSERFEAWGYAGAGTDASPFLIGGAKPYVQSNLLERLGVMGVVQFEPNAAFSSTLDLFYSDFQEDQSLRGIEFPLAFFGLPTSDLTASDGIVTSGVFSNQKAVARNDFRGRQAETMAIGWNNQWDVSDNWSLEFDASYSNADRIDTDLETYQGTSAGGGNGPFDTLGFARLPSGRYTFLSTIDYANPGSILLTDPNGWGQVGFIKKPSTDDTLTALRLNATRELSKENFGPLSAVEVGVNVQERDKKKRSDEAFLRGFTAGGTTASVPTEFLLEDTALNSIGIPGLVSYDPLALFNSGFYTTQANTNADVRTKSWDVSEKTYLGYLKFLVDTQALGRPVTGNVGFQVVHTDQESTGAAAGGATDDLVRDVTDGDKYTDFLPSLNLSWEIADQQFLRLGVARTLARARMDQMNASFGIGYNLANEAVTDADIINSIISGGPQLTYWGGGGGNPKLQPWRAQGVDLSWEKYFGDGGYISVAGFYKYLESFVYNETVLFDFSGFPPAAGSDPQSTLGFASTPQNANGGEIKGLEFSASVPFDLITPYLEGFGAQLNASFTDSSITVPGNPGSALPGLSEKVVNTTIYYENHGFSARVSNRSRDDFLGEITGFGAGRNLVFVEGESVTDAQLGYAFEQGPLEGLSVLLQANNLTDERFSTYFNGDPRQVRDSQRYGTTYLIGLNYRR